MRILFLTRLYWPHVGGVERHIEEVTKRLSDEDIKTKIITTKYEKNLKARESKDGVEIVRFEQPKIKYLGLFYTWFWLLKHIGLIKQSEIIHVHDVFIWYWPFKIFFPKKKVFVTFHGRWGKYPIPLKDIIQKKIGAKLSEKVMCIGDYIPKNYDIPADVISYGAVDVPKGELNKAEKSVIYLKKGEHPDVISGIKPIQKVSPKASTKRDRRPRAMPVVIYVGRLDKDIALNSVLKVLSKLKGYEIEFLGDGELRNECEKYGKVHGFTDPAPFYKKAKFCFASGYLTILEALAHKCLVFTSYSHPLQKDYYSLAPFSKYIVSSSSHVKLLEKFKYYEKNAAQAQKTVNSGYNWVSGQTWEKLTNQYLQLWGLG